MNGRNNKNSYELISQKTNYHPSSSSAGRTPRLCGSGSPSPVESRGVVAISRAFPREASFVLGRLSLFFDNKLYIFVVSYALTYSTLRVAIKPGVHCTFSEGLGTRIFFFNRKHCFAFCFPLHDITHQSPVSAAKMGRINRCFPDGR